MSSKLSAKPVTEKKLHLEILRLISIVLVVYNHTPGYNGGWWKEQNQLLRAIMLFFSVFDKIAVTVFFMISGALLFNKEESYKDLFSKRILRMCIVLFVMTGFYFVFKWGRASFSLSTIEKFPLALWSGKISEPLWFLYLYLGFLLFLPFLRKIAPNIKRSDIIWLFALSIAFRCVIYIIRLETRSAMEGSLYDFVRGVTSIPFASLFGYYLEHKLPDEAYTNKSVYKKTALISSAVSIAALIITSLLVYHRSRQLGEFNQDYYNILIIIPAITVYYLVKLLITNNPLPEKARNVIVCFGGGVFGAYLFEELYRRLGVSIRIYSFLSTHIGVFAGSLVWAVLVAFAGILTAMLLKKIPGVKKFL